MILKHTRLLKWCRLFPHYQNATQTNSTQLLRLAKRLAFGHLPLYRGGHALCECISPAITQQFAPQLELAAYAVCQNPPPLILSQSAVKRDEHESWRVSSSKRVRLHPGYALNNYDLSIRQAFLTLS